MDIGGLLSSANLFDVVAVLFLAGMFVLGFFQGTIRRILGIASMLFSFLLAAQLRDPLGKFLASHWTQFAASYSYMLAFLGVFLFTWILFSIIIQSFYKHQAVFGDARLADELLGGVLGVLQGMLLLGIGIVILDSYFKLPGATPDPDELPFLRPLFEWYDPSAIAGLFRDSLIPAVVAILGPFIPDDIRAMYQGSGG